MKKTTKLKQLIKKDEILIIPGVYDALGAKIGENAGFKALIMGGYPTAASLLGQPDVGYVTMTEMVENAKHIANSVDISLFVDGDTGYGNALSVMRTVKEFEQAGVSGIFFEDQQWPKRCGHMDGKKVISMEEHCKKIEAAVKAKEDPDLVIVARTDARAVNGLDDAVKRGNAYAEAGADLIFVEAPQSIDELKIIAKSIKAPKLVNVVEHGRTPSLTAEEYHDMGFDVVIFPLSSIYTVSKALLGLFKELKEKGTTRDIEKDMISFNEFNKLIGLPKYRKLEEEFLTDSVIKDKYGNLENLEEAMRQGR
ncbi:isocitrate lyase/PEP mutase family protein [Clostridium sp. JNZ X4-2]